MSQVFINKALRKDIPSDAVILTKAEAIEMQWNIINSWQEKRQTWPFSIGLGVLSSTNAATSLTIIQHYRNKLKLANYGRITLALPTVAIPCILSVVSHRFLITNNILLGEECPLCVQTRAAAMQVGLGVAVPFIVTPIGAFFFAHSYATFNVPGFKIKNFPLMFDVWLNISRRMFQKLPIIAGINAFVAAALTYFEADAFYKIQSVVYEREKQFKEMLEERRNR